MNLFSVRPVEILYGASVSRYNLLGSILNFTKVNCSYKFVSKCLKIKGKTPSNFHAWLTIAGPLLWRVQNDSSQMVLHRCCQSMQEDSVSISSKYSLNLFCASYLRINSLALDFGNVWHNFGFLCRLNDNEGVSTRATGIQHNFNTVTFLKPRFCDHCGKQLRGLRNQVLYAIEHEESTCLCRDYHARILDATLASTPTVRRWDIIFIWKSHNLSLNIVQSWSWIETVIETCHSFAVPPVVLIWRPIQKQW